MSLQLRLFGGGQPTAGKISASNDGSHAIDKSKVLAQTDAGVITPKTPGNFSSIRSVPVVPDPRYFDREQADALKNLAKEKTDGARQSKRAYKSLAKSKRPTRLCTRNIANMRELLHKTNSVKSGLILD
jgi:DnaJ-domain-containing protein 1